MSYEVHYKIDHTKIHIININKKATIQDLLDAVSKKHNKSYQTIYSKNFSAYLDHSDSLKDWPPDEDNEVFYFSTNDELHPDDYEKDGSETSSEDDESESLNESTSGITKSSQNQKQKFLSKIADQKQKFESQIEVQKQVHEQELTDLINELNKLKEKNKEQEKIIEELQKENSQLLAKNKPQKTSQKFEILDDLTIENIEKIEEIGFGISGKVYKVSQKEFYAMKEMHSKSLTIEKFRQFLNEYEIMNLLHHPNIIKTFGILMDSSKHPPSILLEYCSQNLQTAIEQKVLSNEEIVTSIYQIAKAMKYVHFRKVIHRDLKPTNILIANDGTIKITDFGSSKLMTLEQMTMSSGIGTQKYMAPEIINEENDYDEKVDVYSFGVVVFFILSGGQIPNIKIGEILKGKKAPLPPDFTKFAKKLIYNCWNFKSKDRPSFKEIVDQIESNHYDLLKLTKLEIKNVDLFIENHKAKIPHYD